jgi:CheY-like chemotaxis protein
MSLPAGLRILVLEDDVSHAELISFYLEEDGFTVLTINDDSRLFEVIGEFQPDLITMDMELPTNDGFWVLHKLRENPKTRRIPVVFITIAENKRAEALRLGANGFVTKPFLKDDLRQVINRIYSAQP